MAMKIGPRDQAWKMGFVITAQRKTALRRTPAQFAKRKCITSPSTTT
jgi:hypothetical protein